VKLSSSTRLVGLLVLLVALFGGACSNVPQQVPTGDPLEVVKEAPDRTVEAGPVRVFVAAPGESLEAQLDLARASGPSDVRTHALDALQAVRDAEQARAYGGQQVRGASAMRYEVTTGDGGEFDLWIDVEGRVRRVLLPDGPLAASPPPTQANGLPALVTIDFVFDDPGPVIAPGGPDL
jgi:hypothetical protein